MTVLTQAQRDGLACVTCGADLVEAAVPSVPVAVVDGGQVFACASHGAVGQDDGMDLVSFLQARLNEDEQTAREAGNRRWLVEDNAISLWPEDEHDGFMTWPTRADARHAYRWQPERVLAEVEAKRKLLDSHYDYRGVCTRCFDWQNKPVEREQFPCEVVRLLALPYADDPDYRDEWRP